MVVFEKRFIVQRLFPVFFQNRGADAAESSVYPLLFANHYDGRVPIRIIQRLPEADPKKGFLVRVKFLSEEISPTALGKKFSDFFARIKN